MPPVNLHTLNKSVRSISSSPHRQAPALDLSDLDLKWAKRDAVDIELALQENKIVQWGFVIFRCTYGSQEKWDKFIARIKEPARAYLEATGMEHVYEKMAWTIIEDAEALDGADILHTSRMFEEWVTKRQGAQELRGREASA